LLSGRSIFKENNMLNTRAERLGTPRSTGRGLLQLVSKSSSQDSIRDRNPEATETGLGSLDAAAALGLNPFKSPVRLWMEKTGRQDLLHPKELPEDSLSYWGQLLEPIVAAHYIQRTGRKVRRLGTTLRHSEHPWMFAAPRREIVDTPDVQYLECLSVGMRAAPLWTAGLPVHVRIQGLHQLAVTGAQVIDVVALICGQEAQIHRVERNEAEISRLIEGERAFWRCVEADRAPPPVDDHEDGREDADDHDPEAL
jgi:putative phage-type endonuclease